MPIEELTAFIEQSFDDQRLSRNEASVFRDLLKEHNPQQHDLAQLRKAIFAHAQEAIRHPHDREVLTWLDDLVRVLLNHFSTHDGPQPINESHFFPSDESLRRLISCLTNARSSLDICVFTITDNRIARAIIDAHKRGVAVRVITDNDKAYDRGSDVIELSDEGIPLTVDQTENHMHHKYAVIDRELLVNGSFNWTRSASQRNEENIIITNEPSLVRSFLANFEELWTQLRTP